MPTRAKPPPPGRRRTLLTAAGAVATLALLGAIASLGGPHDFLGGLSAVLYTLARAGAPAAAYLLGAIGLGRLFAPLTRSATDRPALQIALGLGGMLTLSHLLGCLGVFSGPLAMPIALGLVGTGLVLLGLQIRARLADPDLLAHITIPWPILLAIPAACALLVAACNPPGWLWRSEAGGYDALSYHLQLPQEWLALGRIRPLEHNVYSFLPGYIESAFVHLAAMTDAAPRAAAGTPAGLLAGEGLGILSCQLLSAGIALITAALVGRATLAALRRTGLAAERTAAAASGLAGALFLCTPWTVVTGSLAYNDLAVVALAAGALISATDTALAPTRRGITAGLLVGLACGCKPTALFLAGPPVGLLLLGCAPPTQWGRLILGGAAAGLLALAPWLIRNLVSSSNPVFPLASSLFGPAHWTHDQVARYLAGHSFHGSLAARLALLFSTQDQQTHAGARGILHPQWLAFFPTLLIAAAVALARHATRRIALLLTIGLLAQLLAWLFFTHIQSRFLIPLLAPGCIIVGLALAAIPQPLARPALASAAILCLAQTTATLVIFAGQRDGHPNALLLAGPHIRTGAAERQAFASANPQEQREFLMQAGPEVFINLTAPPGAVVYLLGDATPLYYTVPVRYNTTWDRWPLAEAMREKPGDPAAWAAALRRQGITHILINLSEISRLSRSGWSDPAITPESIRPLFDSQTRVIRAWPELGSALYELAPEPPR